jgi:hypothetical protein
VNEHQEKEEGLEARPHPFRPRDELVPPPARRVSDGAIMRFEGIYEVDPELMSAHLTQQSFPNWDTLRIAHSREDHLEWMQRHWASKIVSGQSLLDEIDAE